MNTQKSHVVAYEIDSTSLVIHHSLLNKLQEVEFESIADKDDFINSISLQKVQTGIECIDSITAISDLDARSEVLKQKQSYLSNVYNKINFLGLMMAEECNLGCSYCIASVNMNESRKNKSILMPWWIAKQGIDWYFNLSITPVEYYINFSGGEPLLNKEVVMQSINYIRLNYNDRPIRITINTNATLIDKSIAEFFASNKVEIATSLDGVPSANDKVRVTKSGLPTSAKIIAGWNHLINAGCKLTGFIATFNDKNINYLNSDIIDFALDMGFSWVRIDCDVINLLNYSVEESMERIWTVYKYGLEKNVMVEGFWSTPFDNLLNENQRSRNPSFFCGAVSGETVSIHPNGRISACGFSSGNLGSLLGENMFQIHEHKKLVADYYPGSRDFCKGCSIEGSCAGGCNITREMVSLTENHKVIDYNCTIYRELTKRLLVDYFTRTIH